MERDILDYYNEGREQDRLVSFGRLEFLRTQELLDRHLPPPPASILDIGGGAGIHALPLQERGYKVTLIDPVELHIQQAMESGVVDASVGNARHLQLEDDAADVALLLVTRVRDPLTVSSQGVEDLIGRLVPDEWFRFVVPVVHPCGDG